MKDDEKINVMVMYGMACTRPLEAAKIIHYREPKTPLEAAWWAAMAFWQEIVIPSFLFALAFTALKFAWFA